MTHRPDWKKCVRRDKTLAWCGRRLGSFEWVLLNPGHAEAVIAAESYTVPCRRCKTAYRHVLAGSARVAV